MNDIEKSRKEMMYIEKQCLYLQNLENISMYKFDIMEMANYTVPELPYGIWFDEQGKTRINTHNIPRVKIMMSNNDMIPVSVENVPQILLKGTQLAKAEKILKGKSKAKMFKFISKNSDLILKHWEGDITTVQLFTSLVN